MEYFNVSLHSLNNLYVHWATRMNGHHGGDDFAESWMGGKRGHKQCLGVIECDNPDSFITVQPQTSQQGVTKHGHILHVSKDEQVCSQALVNAHPTVGPLGLIVSVPGITGPGESVADISNVFLNAG